MPFFPTTITIMPTSTDITPLFSIESFVKVGLGGAGNYVPKQKRTSSTPIPCPARTTNAVFHTGIGGAGNTASSQNRAFLSVDEEMDRSLLRRGSAATSWHHGIGGAGNRASSDDGSFASSSLSSSSSWKSSGEKSGADRIKEKIISKWEVRNQRVSLFDAWQRKLPTLSKETMTD